MYGKTNIGSLTGTKLSSIQKGSKTYAKATVQTTALEGGYCVFSDKQMVVGSGMYSEANNSCPNCVATIKIDENRCLYLTQCNTPGQLYMSGVAEFSGDTSTGILTPASKGNFIPILNDTDISSSTISGIYYKKFHKVSAVLFSETKGVLVTSMISKSNSKMRFKVYDMTLNLTNTAVPTCSLKLIDDSKDITASSSVSNLEISEDNPCPAKSNFFDLVKISNNQALLIMSFWGGSSSNSEYTSGNKGTLAYKHIFLNSSSEIVSTKLRYFKKESLFDFYDTGLISFQSSVINPRRLVITFLNLTSRDVKILEFNANGVLDDYGYPQFIANREEAPTIRSNILYISACYMQKNCLVIMTSDNSTEPGIHIDFIILSGEEYYDYGGYIYINGFDISCSSNIKKMDHNSFCLKAIDESRLLACIGDDGSVGRTLFTTLLIHKNDPTLGSARNPSKKYIFQSTVMDTNLSTTCVISDLESFRNGLAFGAAIMKKYSNSWIQTTTAIHIERYVHQTDLQFGYGPSTVVTSAPVHGYFTESKGSINSGFVECMDMFNGVYTYSI